MDASELSEISGSIAHLLIAIELKTPLLGFRSRIGSHLGQNQATLISELAVEMGITDQITLPYWKRSLFDSLSE